MRNIENLQTTEAEWAAERTRHILAECGLDPRELSNQLIERMVLLDSRTMVLEDEERAIGYAKRISEFLSLLPEEKKTLYIGIAFADIGKTGPANAIEGQKELITDMYAIDDPFPPGQTIDDYLSTFAEQLLGSRQEQTDILRSMNIETSMTMREFWNLHAGWSLELVRDGGISKDAALAAGAHHLLEGVNPDGIIDLQNGRYQKEGIDRQLDDRDIFVILLDKYDATRRRGHATHEQAVAYLKGRVAKNEVLDKMPSIIRQLFARCIDDLDQALKSIKQTSAAA